MQIFINECSLSDQFTNQYAFNEAVNIFIGCIETINFLQQEKNILKSQYFFSHTGIKGTHLGTSLKNSPDLNRRFNENLQRLNPKKWEEDQVHSTAYSYVYLNRDYRETSVAELAERLITIKDIKGFLLNFKDSIFLDNTEIAIIKNGSEKIPVPCTYDYDSIYNWLVANKYINPEDEYDESSPLPPADNQTVLKNTEVFELTPYPKNNGRKVYRFVGKNELWVVDSSPKHAGKNAHIEVFNEITCKHLGTSLYNKIDLKEEYKKEGRSINLGNK
jgi:hypothetical protein